jgi:hypothetical protein
MASPSTFANPTENPAKPTTTDAETETKPAFGTPEKTPENKERKETKKENKSATDKKKNKNAKTKRLSEVHSSSKSSKRKFGALSDNDTLKALGGKDAAEDTTGAFKKALRLIPSSPAFRRVRQCLDKGLFLAVQKRVKDLEKQLLRSKHLLQTLGGNNNNNNNNNNKNNNDKDIISRSGSKSSKEGLPPAKRVKHKKGNTYESTSQASQGVQASKVNKKMPSALALLTHNARVLYKRVCETHNLPPGTFMIPESARRESREVAEMAEKLQECFTTYRGKESRLSSPSPTNASERTNAPPYTPTSVTACM